MTAGQRKARHARHLRRHAGKVHRHELKRASRRAGKLANERVKARREQRMEGLLPTGMLDGFMNMIGLGERQQILK